LNLQKLKDDYEACYLFKKNVFLEKTKKVKFEGKKKAVGHYLKKKRWA